MASTAAPELILRLPTAQTQQPQRRRSENVGGENATSAIVESMSGVYQRALSFTGEPAISSESDTGDHCGEEDGDEIMDAAGAASSPVAAGHAVATDDEDGDDDVFDTTPAAVTVESKTSTAVVSADGQYDDLMSFAASVQRQDETQRQTASSVSHLNDGPPKKPPMQVVVNRKNVSVPDSSHTEATTSAIVGATNNLRRHHQQQQQQQAPVFLGACSPVPESSCGAPLGISLFEKLVRTHPIWYLPHIGRVAAVHLLRGKPSGVFIVRRSSQPNSMAISIKLPPGANQDIEHYLLETTIAGVHLEGSPNYFRELPFLLAYYCENGDELHTTLTLPRAILDCETLRDLCSLALLGPEFWTSKHCSIEKPAIRGDGAAVAPITGPRSPSPPTRLKDEITTKLKAIIPKEKLVQSESNPEDIARLSFTGEIQTPQQQPSAVHRRSLSISGYPNVLTKNGETSNRALTATVVEHVGGAFRKPAPFPNPVKEVDVATAPTPAVSKNPGHDKGRSVPAKFRSESVSSALSTDAREATKNQQGQRPQQERRSFRLRNLFEVARRPSVGSAHSPSAAPQQQAKFGLTASLKNKKPKPASFESCKRDTATEVHTAADASTKATGRQQQAIFYVHRRPAPAPPAASPPVPQRPSKRISPSQIPQPGKPKEDHEYYYFSPTALPSPSFGRALNESRSISSLLQEAAAAEERHQAAETPTMSRRLLTFKPGSPTGNDEDVTPTTSSADTTLERRATKKTTISLQTLPADSRQRTTPPTAETRQQSAPPPESSPTPASPQATASSFIRPPVLRREKSDLGWLPSGSGNRAGGIYGTESSKPLQQQRHAILPPENKDETSKKCVEELRRSRLECLRLQMASNANILHSRRDGSAHVISPGATRKMLVATSGVATSPRASPNATVAGSIAFSASAPSSTSNSVLRTKSTRQHSLGATSGPSHRLSAPNLAELSPNASAAASGTTERRAVAELLREIRSRQQQKPPAANVGVLHTINEGLVTPMARRRRGAASKRQADRTTERRLSQSLEDLPTATTSQENPGQPVQPTTTAPAESAKKSGPEKSLRNTSTNLLVRRHESNPAATSCSGIHRRNEKAFHNETDFQWVAVTNEMRHRQKVAKVAPTRSPYSSQTSNGSATALGSKFSDYVMLNECAEIMDGGGNGRVSHEEDAEYESGRYGSIVGGDTWRRHDSQVFSASSSFLPSGGQQQQQLQDVDIDDTRSVVSTAGTVFNEPWDSSVWENLLTLATSMDKNTNRVTTDSRSSFTVSTSSAASSNRPSRVEGTSAALDVGVPSSTTPKEERDRMKKQQPKLPHSRQTALAWAERLKKLKENNIPPPLAPNWEEFSSCVPMSSDSSLPTSTPTNSLESKRKSTIASAAAEASWLHRTGARGDAGDDASPSTEDRFNLAPVGSPLRFRNGTAASNRRGDRSKKRPMNDPGVRIQECVERLSSDITTFFGAQVQYFIKCTMEGHETDPLVVLGNVRQFMNGLKNYLVKHGECDLHPLIEQERSKLRPTEFLNIDAILEGVLQKIILEPLKPHLYRLLVKEATSNGSLEVLSENLAIIRNRPPAEIGIMVECRDSVTMGQVRSSLRKMQFQYSPLKKLEYLLSAVSQAYEHQRSTPTVSDGHRSPSSRSQLPCADELLRWFVYVISHCSIVACEIESIYMWNLLHPALLAGEASYYLTAFSSAVHVLKNVELLPKLNDACSLSSQMGEGGEGYIKVAVPDEVSGAIRYHSFPIMPQLTVKGLCRMIARECGITNPEDYGLYLLMDGYETCLILSECPELVKEHLRTSNKAHLFAYKRHEAKIAWPKVAVSPRL